MVIKSREYYYIVFIYNYYQLNLFLVIIAKFNQKPKFSPDWPKLGLIGAELVTNIGEISSQQSRAVLHSLYVQLLSINFVSSIN